jgi:hypothetical protein
VDGYHTGRGPAGGDGGVRDQTHQSNRGAAVDEPDAAPGRPWPNRRDASAKAGSVPGSTRRNNSCCASRHRRRGTSLPTPASAPPAREPPLRRAGRRRQPPVWPDGNRPAGVVRRSGNRLRSVWVAPPRRDAGHQGRCRSRHPRSLTLAPTGRRARRAKAPRGSRLPRSTPDDPLPAVAATLGPKWGNLVDDVSLYLGSLIFDVNREEAAYH